MYSNNRQAPFFEFVANRLALDPCNTTTPGIPGYLDSLGNATPTGNPGDPINFYAYFSAYGNGGYDPNDVNFVEYDISGTGPVSGTGPGPGIELAFHVAFPILPLNTPPTPALSPAPNPYTTTLTTPFTANGAYLPATYLNPQSFQIISSGIDGLYGVGGQYAPDNTAEALPWDTSSPTPYNTADTSIRIRERDNVTNFHNGKLE